MRVLVVVLVHVVMLLLPSIYTVMVDGKYTGGDTHVIVCVCAGSHFKIEVAPSCAWNTGSGLKV